MSTTATNTLTARWTSTLDGGQTVLSGAGVYPLLALLARYAAGPARDELLAVAPDPARFDLDRSPPPGSRSPPGRGGTCPDRPVAAGGAGGDARRTDR